MGEKKSYWKSFLAGGMGGANVVLVGHPFDTFKVNLQYQTSTAPKFNGLLSCAKELFKQEGIKGFYKGMSAPLISVTPLYALSYYGYALGRNLFEKPGHSLTYPEFFLSGAISGALAIPIIVPIDRIKCMLQVQGKDKIYSGPMDCLKNVWKIEGVRGLYRGTAVTVLRDCPGSGIYFLTYEYLIQNLPHFGNSKDNRTIGRILIAGGSAGVAFWLYAIVPDVLKTRQQTTALGSKGGIIHVFKKTLKNDGLKGFFNGLSPVMIRSFPCNSAYFIGAEYGLKLLNRLFPDV